MIARVTGVDAGSDWVGWMVVVDELTRRMISVMAKVVGVRLMIMWCMVTDRGAAVAGV